MEVVKCDHRNSIGCVQLLNPGLLFLDKVGQYKLSLPVGLVSEGERRYLCEKGGEKKRAAEIYEVTVHTCTHTNTHTQK